MSNESKSNMKKSLASRRVVGIGISLVALLVTGSFQNCAESGMFSASSERGAAESVEVEMNHEDHYVPLSLKAEEDTKSEALLADRYYIRSLLEDIFGPAAQSTASSRALMTNVQVNGSPCSLYEDHRQVNPADVTKLIRADFMQVCSNASADRVNGQVLPKVTVTRQALIAVACSDLVASNQAMGYAFSKFSKAEVPPATDENLLAAVNLFYRNGPEPDQGLMDSMREMFSPAGATLDDWRGLMYAICVSPQWQML
jgi:hypothetical protein